MLLCVQCKAFFFYTLCNLRRTMPVLLLLIIIWVLSHHQAHQPLARHLMAEYSFAHFSYITEKNKWLFPQFALARPMCFEVSAGEAVWIPKKWWHWVVSDAHTIAVSYWCHGSKADGESKPYKLRMENDELCKLADAELTKASSARIWNSEMDTLKNEQTLDYARDRCIITLPGYNEDRSDPMQKGNLELYKNIRPHIPHPPIPIWKGRVADVDMNLWIALGHHDTGLHYDDNDGLLQVLKGRKHVRLYPPSQSRYLAPRSIIPAWAIHTPWCVAYNKYTNYGPLDASRTWPSARLLYESMSAMSNSAAIMECCKAANSCAAVGTYVWGCKWHNGEMRWEVYIYQYDMTSHMPRDARALLPYERHPVKLYDGDGSGPNPLIITSFDIFDQKEPLGTTLHMYYSTQGFTMDLPFRGYGTNVTMRKGVQHESTYIYDTYDGFVRNFAAHMDSIGVEWRGKNLERLLDVYDCEDICIFNKSEDTFFVMYINIMVEDFVEFLVEHAYPRAFVEHVQCNVERYRELRHEIAVVYDMRTHKPIRSAFYGLL